MLVNSTEAPEHLKAEFQRTNIIVDEYMGWLFACMLNTARDPNFNNNHLLSFLHQDILESLMSVKINIIEGVLLPSIRESRYLFELSVKVAHIQTTNPSSSIEEKLNEFNKVISTPNITSMKHMRFSYFNDEIKKEFLEYAGRVYGELCQYVHVTPHSIGYRQDRVNAGRFLGKESVEDLTNVNNLLEKAYAVSLVFLSHSLPQYVVGDWHVREDGKLLEWHYLKSLYIANIDSSFDYKHERQSNLSELQNHRKEQVQF